MTVKTWELSCKAAAHERLNKINKEKEKEKEKGEKKGKVGMESLSKFKRMRHELFSLFDDGIRMNDEMWYSVTPETIAKHVAMRVVTKVKPNGVVVDGMCGAGGNAIQFALVGLQVIAIDINAEHVEMAKHNSEVYLVSDYIEYVTGDFFTLAARLDVDRVDCLYLSPPWGGPGVSSRLSFSLLDEETMFPEMIRIALRFKRAVIFLPRNIIASEFELIGRLDPLKRRIEIEYHRIKLNGFVKACTVYIG
jgi:trimethylguanosine synthase